MSLVTSIFKIRLLYVHWNSRRHSSIKASKMLSKMISKPKKRTHTWYADFNEPSNVSPIPSPVSINKGTQGSKRMAVLNKLLMRSITDLMATGAYSEAIKGFGVVVTKVQVTSDFQIINIYWSYTVVCEQNIIENILNAARGSLRYELSSLRIMGHVPEIRFVRDRYAYHGNDVEAILKTINFNTEDVENLQSLSIKKDFYSNSDSNIDELPEMRQDVFGINRSVILSKIVSTKLKGPTVKVKQHGSPVVQSVLSQNTFTEFLNKQRIERDRNIKLRERAARRANMELEGESIVETIPIEEDDYVEDDEYYR